MNGLDVHIFSFNDTELDARQFNLYLQDPSQRAANKWRQALKRRRLVSLTLGGVFENSPGVLKLRQRMRGNSKLTASGGYGTLILSTEWKRLRTLRHRMSDERDWRIDGH